MPRLPFLALLAVLGGLVACSENQSASVTNTSEPAIIKLTSQAGKQVVSLQVIGSGSIDGSAEIALVLDGKPYRSQHLKGNVSFTWADDWYSPLAEIHYRPTKVQGGRVDLQYRFGTL